MSLAKRVFELQQVEQLIQAGRKQLDEIDGRISRNEAFEQAGISLSAAETDLAGLEKQYKELDAEAETLRAQIKQVNDRLYGGKIKNPKERIADRLSISQEATKRLFGEIMDKTIQKSLKDEETNEG